MKKYYIVISIIAVLIISALAFSVMEIQKENTKMFSEAGYILRNKAEAKEQEVERYYFNANETYKKQYNQKIAFKDTSGENIIIEENNFLHYTNGSISSLSKGVILDLKDLDNDPILYYTIAANSVLRKNGNNYSIKHISKELTFENFIWKISNEKYLICGSPITIHFQNGETKEISGYLELEYSDNEVVKLYNQEATYQTISSNLYITLPDEIKINLSNKIISQNNENKMSLENMIINSDDNIEIVDINDEKYKELDENETDENKIEEDEPEENENQEQNTNDTLNNSDINNSNGNNSTQSNGQLSKEDNNTTTTNNQAAQIVGGSIATAEDEESQTETNNPLTVTETIVEETPQFVAPTFKVEEFDVDSISMTAKITIQDEESSLIDDPIIKIIRNDTGKTVYENEETTGTFSIDVNVSSLMPDTEYTMIVQATYKVEEAEYTKNFVYKIFRTQEAGIEIEKDYFTNSVLAFKCIMQEDSKVKSADIVLMDTNGEVIETKKIDSEQLEDIQFTGLNSNTSYIVEMTNILYDGQVITNGFQNSQTYKTLKDKPEISGAQFEIDKRNGNFLISVKDISDADGGITSCRYEIYDTRIEGEEQEPIVIINSNKNEQVTVPVDGNKIQRGVPYTFKLVADFNDNEKEMEFESEYSDIMMMDGVEFPTVRFDKRTVTFERIEGTIIVDDINNTIDLSNDNLFTIIYTDSVGISNSFTSKGSLQIPVSINGLRSNETYKFSVYTKVDLQDGNDPIDNCYIGGVVVKTEIPQDLLATFSEEKENVKNAFTLNFQLKNAVGTVGDLEAQTLSGLTFTIYAGQTAEGTPVRAPLKIVDTNLEAYESVIKEEYYDRSIQITPEFFGANNKDFRDKYYTITVTNAYDYTTYQNKIPIQENTYTIETNGYRPDYPSDTENALDVSGIRNRDKDRRADIDSNIIVGYEVKAKFSNVDLTARKITYKVYDSTTKELLQIKEAQIGSDGVIPSMQFDVGDGTSIDIKDTDMPRRGNSYYFTYELLLDLNGDGIGETVYPYVEDNTVLQSREVTPIKQEAKIEMYPSTSTANTVTYKYKILDVDNSLQNNQIVASIGGNIRDTKTINISQTSDTYSEVTFENLTEGNFLLNVSEVLNKNEFANTKKISEYYFEGKVVLSELKHNVKVDSNRVVITLLNADSKINRIAAVDVEFVGSSQTIKKEFLYPENNIIIVNLNEIEALRKENVTVNVYAYYDTGLIGFDMEGQYKLFQKTYKSGETKYYYYLNNAKNLVPTPTATENMYIASRTDNILNITSPINSSKNATINLMKLEGGFAYEYELMNQKQVEKVLIQTDGTNKISFDTIIPGISLLNSAKTLNITSELKLVRFKADLLVQQSTTLENNLIYIDIYKTDASGNNEEYVKTETRTVNEFKDYITLNDLEPKTYYAMRVRTVIVLETGEKQEEYLYDMDYQVLGKIYYFSTLADVGISDISVTYNPISYNNKSIDIEYSLDRIFGYEKIVYTIERWNEEEQQYEIIFDNMEDTLFRRQMIKQISCNPGSEFVFGAKYNLIIKPIAIIEDKDGSEKELELGTQNYKFELPSLNKPLVGITGTRNDNDDITFKVTVYDNHRIVYGDEYSIKILDNNKQDITPEEYVTKKYSTSSINNKIILKNAEKDKSYTIEVISVIDSNNDATDLETYVKSYTILPLNSNGISIGNITTASDDVQKNKIDLIFTESHNLTEIDQIRYSIYDTNGYSKSGVQEFIPENIGASEENIYKVTIDEGLQEMGRYYIELQFLKEGKVVETYSLEHTFLGE